MYDKPRKSALAWAVSAPALIFFTASLIAGLNALFAGAREANAGYLVVGGFLTPGSAYVLWRVVVAKPRSDVPRAIRTPKRDRTGASWCRRSQDRYVVLAGDNLSNARISAPTTACVTPRRQTPDRRRT